MCLYVVIEFRDHNAVGMGLLIFVGDTVEQQGDGHRDIVRLMADKQGYQFILDYFSGHVVKDFQRTRTAGRITLIAVRIPDEQESWHTDVAHNLLCCMRNGGVLVHHHFPYMWNRRCTDLDERYFCASSALIDGEC